MRAPDHNRINRPQDTHETLLSYDVEFSEEGTYTAYYRARGFDGSSDSIYVPDDFGTDPDDSETLSNNGVYRWETGGRFEITSPNVDVPLEFRIGSREGLSDFDAFVFHVNPNLSPSQLDEFFSLNFAVDFNTDGLVDCADIDALVAAIADGSHTTDFDLTGDGLVDGDDLSMWLADAGDINLGSGAAYLSGDANLDGVVDASDFNIWNANKFTQNASWCSGDFTADGFVDGSDFNAWNSNKFSSSLDVVPEPAGFYGLLLAGMLIWPRKRTKVTRSRI